MHASREHKPGFDRVQVHDKHSIVELTVRIPPLHGALRSPGQVMCSIHAPPESGLKVSRSLVAVLVGRTRSSST